VTIGRAVELFMDNISQTQTQKPAQSILTVGVVREIGDIPARFRCYIATLKGNLKI